MATNSSPDHGPGVGPGIHEEGSAIPSMGEPPALPDDATYEQREEHWRRHVYMGDKVPQLTVRSILMGAVLGMLMSVSNLYTTLKVGWAFGVAITACVMSYVIWNLFRAVSGGKLGRMSILENASMASTASAAGYSTGSTIATMFGALLILAADPEKNPNPKTLEVMTWWTVGSFTLATAALGVFLAIPMKRQMINREQLPFPSGIAAAATLKSLYSEGVEAVRKAYALVVSLFVGAAVGILNSPGGSYSAAMPIVTGADGAKTQPPPPGFFKWIETMLFGRLPELVPHNGFRQLTEGGRWVNAVGADGAVDPAKGKILPAFGFEPSALLIAAGMIVGLRVSLSMLIGSALLYFFVGPWLVGMDAASAGVEGYRKSVELNGSGAVFRLTVWALWGGTALMVVSSLTAVALQWRTIARAFKGLKGGVGGVGSLDSLEVPARWFVAGMIPITIVLVIVQYMAFQISVVWGTVAVAMSFVLSMVAARATGETDTTPIGAMGKVMQLLFAVVHPGQVVPNLAAAGVAANGASSSADLLTDLKTGYLVGANPRKQFIAQFIGIFFGTLAIVPAWYLMVPDYNAIQNYPLPATQQWVAVAKLLTEGVDKLPITARWAIVFGALLGVVLPVIDRLAPKKARPYLPSAMGLGLSWVVPFANALAFAIGAVIAWLWSLAARRNADRYNVAVASGLIAGEGLIKAIIAMSATAVGLTAAAGAN